MPLCDECGTGDAFAVGEQPLLTATQQMNAAAAWASRVRRDSFVRCECCAALRVISGHTGDTRCKLACNHELAL